jgi:hypothetical protein
MGLLLQLTQAEVEAVTLVVEGVLEVMVVMA